MIMSYKNLPDDTRVWIYQSNKALSDKEVKEIKQQGEEFILNWSAHGAKLDAVFETFYNRFIVLFVDEKQAKASGCSIDKSMRFIRQIEKDFDVSLLDRNLVSYMEGENVNTLERDTFIDKVKCGDIAKNSTVFNNLVSNKADFESKWKVPLTESWHHELL